MNFFIISTDVSNYTQCFVIPLNLAVNVNKEKCVATLTLYIEYLGAKRTNMVVSPFLVPDALGICPSVVSIMKTFLDDGLVNFRTKLTAVSRTQMFLVY